jgi:metal-sulfur cluster biosynthetic enzyme
MEKLKKEEILKELEKIKDPEIGHSIVDLGLIYGIKINKEKPAIRIKMTLTSFACPLGGVIEEEIKKRLGEKFNIKDIKIDFVFEPPWTPQKMSEELKRQLGF